MRTFACILLGSSLIVLSVLLQLNLIGKIDAVKEELKRERELSAKYLQKFEECRDQLSVFYRDPCKDNPKLVICK